MRLQNGQRIAVIVAACLVTAACGSNPYQRGVTGGAIGAAAGAGALAIAGGPVLVGAAAGAAGGAAIGALTNECQIDLGPQRPNGC